MTRRAHVYDGQAAMAQAHAPASVVKQGGSPDALIVAPAMSYAFEHRADARLWLYPDQSRNATHDFASKKTLSASNLFDWPLDSEEDCAPIIDE
jgi:hypothetical protein